MSDAETRRYGSVYTNLKRAIRRSEISNYGTVATLLLDTFVHNNGELRAGQVEAKGLCAPGTFKKWRSQLTEAGFLKPWVEGNYSKHWCGPKLLKYVNQAKLQLEEIATREQLEKRLEEQREELVTKKELVELATKKELQTIEEKLARTTAAIDRIINLIDPPSDEEKRERLLRGDYDTHINDQRQLVLINSEDHDEQNQTALSPNHIIQ